MADKWLFHCVITWSASVIELALDRTVGRLRRCRQLLGRARAQSPGIGVERGDAAALRQQALGRDSADRGNQLPLVVLGYPLPHRQGSRRAAEDRHQRAGGSQLPPLGEDAAVLMAFALGACTAASDSAAKSAPAARQATARIGFMTYPQGFGTDSSIAGSDAGWH